MAALTTQNILQTGITPTFVSASVGGDTCNTGRNVHLVVKNGGGSPITVTIGTYPDTTSYGATIPDLVVSVPASGEKWIGPFYPDSMFQNPSTGTVGIAYSAVTSVTVGVFNI